MGEKVRTLPKIWILDKNTDDNDNHHDFNKGEKLFPHICFYVLIPWSFDSSEDGSEQRLWGPKHMPG